MNNKLKGYLWGAIGGATYGMNPLFTLPMYQEGINPDSVLFFRYLFAIPVLAIIMKVTHVGFKITFKEVIPLIFMGIMFAMCSLTLFQSYKYMDAGIASTILFLYPIIVAMIMTLIFREKLSYTTIICLLMATAGIGLLYKGEEGATLSLKGTALVIISALTYAIYIVGINRTRLKSMNTVKVTFYVLSFGWSIFAIRSFMDGGVQTPPPDKWYLWGNLLALGLLPTAVSLLTTTIAIQLIGSTPTAILGALEPATAIIIGITVFNETLTFRETCGLALIIIAVCLVVLARDKKRT